MAKTVKPTKKKSVPRPTPFERAVSRLMKQREVIVKRTTLATAMRTADAEMRQKAAEQTLAGYKQLGWMP